MVLAAVVEFVSTSSYHNWSNCRNQSSCHSCRSCHSCHSYLRIAEGDPHKNPGTNQQHQGLDRHEPGIKSRHAFPVSMERPQLRHGRISHRMRSRHSLSLENGRDAGADPMHPASLLHLPYIVRRRQRSQHSCRPSPGCHRRRKPLRMFEFHISRAARDRYGVTEVLFSFDGNAVFANPAASRALAHRINQGARHPANFPGRPPAPGPARRPLRHGPHRRGRARPLRALPQNRRAALPRRGPPALRHARRRPAP